MSLAHNNDMRFAHAFVCWPEPIWYRLRLAGQLQAVSWERICSTCPFSLNQEASMSSGWWQIHEKNKPNYVRTCHAPACMSVNSLFAKTSQMSSPKSRTSKLCLRKKLQNHMEKGMNTGRSGESEPENPSTKTSKEGKQRRRKHGRWKLICKELISQSKI